MSISSGEKNLRKMKGESKTLSFITGNAFQRSKINERKETPLTSASMGETNIHSNSDANYVSSFNTLTRNKHIHTKSILLSDSDGLRRYSSCSLTSKKEEEYG